MERRAVKGGFHYENCPTCRQCTTMVSRYEYSRAIGMKVLRLYCQRCDTLIRETIFRIQRE